MAPGVAEEQQLGHYAIVREAGQGGTSVVYEARDTRIGRRVALKVVTVPAHLPAEQREAMLARLGREARAIARVSHPSIVSIYDIGEEANRHYLVMEYLDGQTLRDRLADGPLPPAEAARILGQIAGALDAVHAEGVIHRDIKSSNVMLLPDGQPKLMDFGVARQVDDTMVTLAGMMVGSPVYMAPELINGAEADTASDLWSLGILLYEMLVGKPPFAGKTIPTVLYQVTHEPIPPLPGASPEVQAVLARALDRDPSGRYPSAVALADAFREAAAPRRPRIAVVAPLTAARPVRRAYAPLALAALILAALAGGVALLHPRSTPARISGVPLAKKTHAAAVRRRPAPSVTPPTVRVAEIRQERATVRHRHRRRHSPVPVETRENRSQVSAPQPRPAAVAEADNFRPRHLSRRLYPAPELRRREFPPARPMASADTGTPQRPEGLLGTWHGTHTRNPATLTITRAHPGGFDGVMTVRTHEATVRVAVIGRVSGGHVTMRETRVLSQSRPRAWDLGSESGQMGANGEMGGSGTDIKGRYGRWSFSR